MSCEKALGSTARLGLIEVYALDRLAPAPGRQATCSAVFADYRAWCKSRNAVALREAEFVASIEELARAAGIPLRQRGGNLSFMDVELRSIATAAAHHAKDSASR